MMLRFGFLACSVLLASAGVAVGAGLDDMIAPVSVPTLNEDPRITTEIRPMFMHTSISDDFATGGGHYQVVAVQARLALTERIGLIATKDGYVILRPDEVIPEDEGFANIAFGAKAALLHEPEAARIVTAGLRYEAPWGNRDVLMGRGDGSLNPFVTAAQGFGNVHLQGSTGARIAISGDDSDFYDLSVHADYQIDRFYPLVELNWIHVLSGGRRLPIDQEGFDLVNVGSTDAGGVSVATVALGARYRVSEWLDLGAAWETPITSREDIIDWRVTTDAIVYLW